MWINLNDKDAEMYGITENMNRPWDIYYAMDNYFKVEDIKATLEKIIDDGKEPYCNVAKNIIDDEDEISNLLYRLNKIEDSSYYLDQVEYVCEEEIDSICECKQAAKDIFGKR